MKISWKELSSIIITDNLSGITVGAAVGIVQRIYCGPMTVKGMCTGSCADCASPLKSAFNLRAARNKQALLTYLLKSAVAKNQESFFRKSAIAVKKNRYGLPIAETDPIEKALADLGV